MRYSHYIAGKWIEGRGTPFISTNPATNAVIWEGAEATQEEVSSAVSAAKEALPKWSSYSFDQRVTLLKKYEKILKEKKTAFTQTISEEIGKPLWEAELEVAAMIAKVDLSIEAYKARSQNRHVNGHLYTYHKPHGAVAVFAPFNFPGYLPTSHIIPALLAGNTIVLKSSPLTPLVAQMLITCLTHLPEGVVNMVQGGSATGHLLADHPQIDGIFFNGSHKVGTELIETVRHHPEKILVLEMGGNNPLIVSEIDDLEAAAYQTIQSAYLTAGQRCTCARRLIIPIGREGDEFLKVLTHMIASIQVGSYTSQPEPFMGPLIHNESVEQLLHAQATYGSEGGKCLVEMVRLHEGLPFLTPGMMDVTHAPRVDEELFGPFLKVIRVPTFEEALKEANHTGYGLVASLLSSNREKYRLFFHLIKAGILNWNHPTTGASSNAPFGGVKKSGNFHPSGYYAADYCTYPVASMQKESVDLPANITPGISLLTKT